MTRPSHAVRGATQRRSMVLAAASAVAFITILAAPGCKATGVGDPCTPEEEYDKSFTGFDVGSTFVESASLQCQTRACLVNHFQGRVTCPFGQTAEGAAPPGGAATETCKTPAGVQVDGKDEAGNVVDARRGAEVPPQCKDRTANRAVYCSCRCANADGKTDDGASYCSCPDGFTCSQVLKSIGSLDQGLTGAYCIKKDTEYSASGANCVSKCQPGDKDCQG